MPDILLTKLRPGQQITLEAHAKKGIGQDHAKFSPVSTASYRMVPNVSLLSPVTGPLAEELCVLEPGVFTLFTNAEGVVEAKVSDPLACTMSRNYARNPELEKRVRITRSATDFVFSIESVGQVDAVGCLKGALEVMAGMADELKGRVTGEEE